MRHRFDFFLKLLWVFGIVEFEVPARHDVNMFNFRQPYHL